MKDINICKTCKHFISGVDFIEMCRRKDVCAVLRKTHWCDLYTWKPPMYEYDMVVTGGLAPKEYYRMTNTRECPYYSEHLLFEMNNEEKMVDYGFFSRFRRTRVCQHCGMEIPNISRCPNCGFLKFGIRKCSTNEELDRKMKEVVALNRLLTLIAFLLMCIMWTRVILKTLGVM